MTKNTDMMATKVILAALSPLWSDIYEAIMPALFRRASVDDKKMSWLVLKQLEEVIVEFQYKMRDIMEEHGQGMSLL